MKKENVIILLIVTFIAGFLAGAVGGIKFYAREHTTEPAAVQADAAPHPFSADEAARLEAAVRKDP